MSAGKCGLIHTSFLTQLDNKSVESMIIILGILSVILNGNCCAKLVIFTSTVFHGKQFFFTCKHYKELASLLEVVEFNTYCMHVKKR